MAEQRRVEQRGGAGLSVTSVVSQVNQTFNPLLGTANATRLAAVLGLYFLWQKKKAADAATAESSMLGEVPRKQATVAPAERPGETGIYRYYKAPLYPEPLPSVPFAGVETLYDNFQRGVRLFPGRPCLGHRPIGENGEAGPFVWQTYHYVNERMTCIGSALAGRLGLEKGTFVGIMMINRPEWTIVEQACNAHALVTVPLYDTLGANVVEYIAAESGLQIAFGSAATIGKLLEAAAQCPALRTLVSVDEIDEKLCATAKASGVTLYTLRELEAYGRTNPHPHRPPAADDLATICYTSGTTGNPKGAMLTHRNFITGQASVEMGLSDSLNLNETEVHISYLPLAHVYERFIQVIILGRGASIGFFQGDVLKLLEDIALLRPTMFVSVPRLYNRIYDKIMATISESAVKQALFNIAFKTKLENFEATGAVEHPFWDWLLFSKIKEKLGGRVKIMMTGSAPISGDVLNFLRLCFSCQVMEGYGQTEGTAMATSTIPGDNTSGHVGPPAPSAELKLVDVPEMNYLSSDKPYPRGELCVRSPARFVGYYKQEQKTKDTIDEDGWLHSGDICAVLPNGCFKIIDRKKNIFKLAQGEYIAPEKIENVFIKSKWVAQAFVHGDSLEAFLVAIVVPDEEVLLGWSSSQGPLAKLTLAELCANEAVATMIYNDVVAHCKGAKLHGFEIPKAIKILPEPFSLENGLLTPTMKLKRQPARQHFEAEIAALNAQVKNGPAPGKAPAPKM